jgi:hypothetical protein
MRADCSPLQTPQTAAGKNSSKHKRGSDSTRNRCKQKQQGANDSAALTHSVRRDSMLTANPHVQAQAASSTAFRASDGADIPVANPRLMETEKPINKNVQGNARPTAARPGRPTPPTRTLPPGHQTGHRKQLLKRPIPALTEVAQHRLALVALQKLRDYLQPVHAHDTPRLALAITS